MTKYLVTITEETLFTAIEEVREGKHQCHCLIARAIFDELGIPIVTIMFWSARLQNMQRVKWTDGAVYALIERFDNQDYIDVARLLPYQFEISVEDPMIATIAKH